MCICKLDTVRSKLDRSKIPTNLNIIGITLYLENEHIDNGGKGKGKKWGSLTATLQGHFQIQKVVSAS